MKYLRRPSASDSAGSAGSGVWMDPEFLRVYPALGEFLSCSHWDNGDPRETGTFLVFVEDGNVKCCLMDRACGRKVFVTAETFAGLLELLELGLAGDRLDWRRDAQQPRKKGSR